VAVDGLGDRLRALGRTPDGRLLAISSSSVIYTLDLRAMTAKLRVRPVTAPLPRGALTFTVAPDGETVRLIAGARDLTIDLAPGATTQNSDQAPPVAADFFLVGVDTATSQIVAAGPLGFAAVAPLGTSLTDRTTTTTASDGTQWILRAPVTGRPCTGIEIIAPTPSTGMVTGAEGPLLASQLQAAAALDVLRRPHVAQGDGHRAEADPSAWCDHGLEARVKANEPAETMISARAGGKVVAVGFVAAECSGASELVARAAQWAASVGVQAGAPAHQRARPCAQHANDRSYDQGFARLSLGFGAEL
jgi:hypothetical protein